MTSNFPKDSRDEDDIEKEFEALTDEDIQAKLDSLVSTLILVEKSASSELVDAFLNSYKELLKEGSYYSPQVAFPTIFDLLVTAEYAKRMLADAGWTYCRGNEYPEGSALYFPFLKACPRCSVHQGKRQPVKSNKPGSDSIGAIAGNATLLLLCKILEYTRPTAQIRKSTDRRGDVDLVISDDDIFILAEIKSSPLVVYPLEILLTSPMTEVKNGITQQLRDHSPATSRVEREDISLYIAHKNKRIRLGTRSEDNWAYSELINYVSDKRNVAFLIEAWSELQDVYRAKGRDSNGRIDNRKWITYGCGGGVDDSKNAPGIDRTDDIKKGTYQVLKLGAYYKEKAPEKNISTILVANFFAYHTNTRYLEEIQDVLWTKPKYEIHLKDTPYETEMRGFRKDAVFNLYDAIICFTEAIFYNEKIEEIFSYKKFLEAFLR
ncbi:hypothetical protein H6F78_03060 [Coleofasciculus sp. FACHB-64]|uniref:hypothetical protein n=1 Tax=Cyanophyceae TaxID=3028117 RepID=UPI0016837C31|nr:MULTISPECIES: hypothetical protein [unclassified Coleofasciculus]MBD1945777.1 hypothetical protein [Coleofasciculus sp. FACHB-712]MBD2044620.1 hypothetical protein [Coleofasciculus sp. FACHB-64]